MERKLIGAIADIDDTLIPWEKPHAAAYPAMSGALAEVSGLPHEQIVAEIRAVNTTHGTIEYTALIQEMESFRNLSSAEQRKLIDVAIKSRREAMEGLNQPFEDIDILLETLQVNGMVRLAISDAPKNLAYLRLLRAGMLKPRQLIDQVIGTESPPDHFFQPEFHMENREFEIPTSFSRIKKPDTNLEEILNKTAAEIRKQYFLFGNSAHSDMGLAKSYGLLFYWTRWDNGTDQERAILKQYAPESALKHNVGTAEDKTRPIHPDFEIVEVFSPREMLQDLKKRKLIE